MFVAVYRWRVKPGYEAKFREGWLKVTDAVYQMYGSLGSRLHRDADGSWVAYAQWPDEAAWREAWQSQRPIADPEGYAMLKDSVETCYELAEPVMKLTVLEDRLKSQPYSNYEVTP
ncbi:antibiotic biosynthesis monooxygenase family protein [Methylomonas sp. LWB]|uniref:antibiotic biosynthesis monooxygenase family protein n=1 Tax=unclassified Methylomonas TaxID=2608980 RepID=UPI0008D9EEB2|nr:antibiotic biosynthesis monooxygenase family protein [Methylomonas sp. LWB]OHX34856.1 hypothetical protein BJL95_12320 [Methylomonas sp. LWB]